ncbi:thionin-like protein 2 isoform X2 [Capsella rubella]|uniref:thionin-like protein 2 isoform X2 n=1 Tax=Capsella rubella TaxID=81985 RepID=UPI000CD4F69F|nr:thionin-like protein 2 isoform X2 [Capsella rubella]
MESKRMVMFVIMMVLGNLLIHTEAQAPPQPSPFKSCYKGCVVVLPSPPSEMVSSTNEVSYNDYYCKLGCATHHCVSLSSTQNPNVDKVADCVDSCSDKCSIKN